MILVHLIHLLELLHVMSNQLLLLLELRQQDPLLVNFHGEDYLDLPGLPIQFQ